MKIAVYGNLIHDQILSIESPLRAGQSYQIKSMISRAGGSANFCRALSGDTIKVIARGCLGKCKHVNDLVLAEIAKYCHEYSFHYQFDQLTSSAIVVSDLATNSRTGFVNWGACSTYVNWVPDKGVDWHHFMYIDKMKVSIDTLKKCVGHVSVDFCDNKEIIKHTELLKHVDYLFASDYMDIDGIPTRKGCIIHAPSYAYFRTHSGTMMESFMVEQNLNVVGAGDYFAAFCIAQLMGSFETNFLEKAHKQTLKLLRAQS